MSDENEGAIDAVLDELEQRRPTDATQHAFLKLLEKKAAGRKVEVRSSVNGYVTCTIKNAERTDWYRQNADRRRVEVIADKKNLLGYVDAGPEVELDQTEDALTRLLLNKASDILLDLFPDDDERVAFVAIITKEKTQVTAAEELGKPYEAFAKSIQRAKAKLANAVVDFLHSLPRYELELVQQRFGRRQD